MEKLNEVCFGKYFFKVGIILRNSNLISSLLINAEAWYNVTQADIDLLESADESLIRRILECPLSTPKEMLYLELGILPIRYIIQMRRLNFLQYILYEEENSLVHSFLKTQLDNPTAGDWGNSCLESMEALNMELDISDIKIMKKSTFNNLVKKKTCIKALEDLNKQKAKHSKVLHIVHSKLKMETYLEGNKLLTVECKFLFHVRSRMLELKANFKNSHEDTICPCCQEEEDTQEHLLSCENIHEGNIISESLPNYKDLVGENELKQAQVCRILRARFEKRKQFTTSKSGPCDPYYMWSAVAMYY